MTIQTVKPMRKNGVQRLEADLLNMVRITGNGSGAKSLGLVPSLDVAFNLPLDSKPKGNQLFIRNKRIANTACCHPFKVESECLSAASSAGLEKMLATKSAQLAAQLGCMPSSGLATVNCFSELAQTLQVDCMPLHPSLIRPAALSTRQPLPCVFHNWLGERRLARDIIARSSPKSIKWPELSSDIASNGGSRQADAANRLRGVFQENCAHPAAQSELRDLATASNESWLETVNLPILERLEPHFFLPRAVQDSGQWWLYDNDASWAIDTIVKRLMWCQQALTALRLEQP